MVRHMDDLGLYLAGATDFPDYERSRAWFRDNDSFRKDILKLLEKSGPLVSREIPDTCAVPWASSGWTHNRNVTQMLEFMMMRGEIAISSRVGRERVWDLAERVYPDVDVPSVDEAERPGRPAVAGDDHRHRRTNCQPFRGAAEMKRLQQPATTATDDEQLAISTQREAWILLRSTTQVAVEAGLGERATTRHRCGPRVGLTERDAGCCDDLQAPSEPSMLVDPQPRNVCAWGAVIAEHQSR